MKRFCKYVSLILALLFVATTLFACGDKAEDQIESKESWTGRGVHTADVKDGDGYFVKNGTAEYSLVIPAQAKDYEVEAAEFINKYTERATGAVYPVITDDKVVKGGKYISLGETELLHQSGIAIPFDKYGNSGFRCYTKDGVLFLAGARSNLRKGTLFAAQEFLKYTIGFKAYAVDEVQFDTMASIKQKTFDVVEIPEFDGRLVGTLASKDREWCNLLRNTLRKEGELPFYTSHSHFVILPPETYFEDHPDWYWYKFEGNTECTDYADMFVNGQLCLSNEEMIEEFVNQLVQWFRDYPDAELAHLGMQDSQTVCQCSNCDAVREKYGTNEAGLNMLFTNKVAEMVNEEIQKTEPDRKLYFQTFAYLTIIEPPATRNEDGSWTPHCDEVIPNEYVYIQYASLKANTTESIDHKVNAYYYQALEGWSALCKMKNAHLSTWLYNGVNFNWMMVNYKEWDIIVDVLRTFSDMGCVYVYNEHFNNAQGCAFVALRSYVDSMLMWNLSLNFDDLAKDFIANYYGPAAEYVQQAYDQMTVHYEKLTEEGLSGAHNIDIGINQEGRWTLAYVESQRILFEKAFDALEEIKDEKPLDYQKYYKRLIGEYMENMYMQLEFHMSNYGSEYIKETIDLFEKACKMHGMINFGNYSGRTVEEYLVKWRGANV